MVIFIPEINQREILVVLQLLFDGASKLNTDIYSTLDLAKTVKVIFFKVLFDKIAVCEEFKVFNKLYWLQFAATTFSGNIHSTSSMNIILNYPEYNKKNEISTVNTGLVYNHFESNLIYEIPILKTQSKISKLTPAKESRKLVYSNMNNMNMNDLLINLIQM